MARFLVAPDSFKGTFDAPAVAAAIAAGLRAGGAAATECPLGDGGEGTAAVLLAAAGGEWVAAPAHDPLRRPLEARFALLGDGGTAVVEAAAASGLGLLAPAEIDAERADTFGTGELILAAVAAGARRVLVAAGGSATTDGGRGALEAIAGGGDAGRAGAGRGALEAIADGVDAGDAGPGPLGAIAGGADPCADPGPGPLEAIATGPRADGAPRAYSPRAIDRSALGAELAVLCDVTTPYEDAARAFAPQKGADPAAVARLAERLDRLAAELPRDPRGVPMTGCAGGLSGGLWATCGAELLPGGAYVMTAVGFPALLASADAVVSGEGAVDSQSFEGKVVGGVAAACAAAGVPLYVCAGRDDLAPGPDRDARAAVRETPTLAALEAAGRELAARS